MLYTVDMENETKARYAGYGEVEILKTEGSLSQIRTPGEQEFWVKTEKLKVRKGHVLVDSLVSAPIAALAPTNPMPLARLETAPQA